jgi:hypothetical protein
MQAVPVNVMIHFFYEAWRVQKDLLPGRMYSIIASRPESIHDAQRTTRLDHDAQ